MQRLTQICLSAHSTATQVLEKDPPWQGQSHSHSTQLALTILSYQPIKLFLPGSSNSGRWPDQTPQSRPISSHGLVLGWASDLKCSCLEAIQAILTQNRKDSTRNFHLPRWRCLCLSMAESLFLRLCTYPSHFGLSPVIEELRSHCVSILQQSVLSSSIFIHPTTVRFMSDLVRTFPPNHHQISGCITCYQLAHIPPLDGIRAAWKHKLPTASLQDVPKLDIFRVAWCSIHAFTQPYGLVQVPVDDAVVMTAVLQPSLLLASSLPSLPPLGSEYF